MCAKMRWPPWPASPSRWRRPAAFGIVQVDTEGRIVGFQEKPDKDPLTIPGDPTHCLASMGNYVFAPGPLAEQLMSDAGAESHHDFGRNILPELVKTGKVFAYDFSQNRIPGVTEIGEQGYWRDVGTIEAYYEANLDLKNVVPHFNLYNWEWPILSANYPDPPSKLVFDDTHRRGVALQSVMASGCIIAGGFVKDCVLGRNVFIDEGADVRDSILLDNVYIGQARPGAAGDHRQERARRRRRPHRPRPGPGRHPPPRQRRRHHRGGQGPRHPAHPLPRPLAPAKQRPPAMPHPSASSDALPATKAPVSLVVHGHFYQPPRENPWTDEISREPSAAPFHDWNARILAECYRANGFARMHGIGDKVRELVNNYAHLSFNVGPTLARFIEREDATTLERMRAGDAGAGPPAGNGRRHGPGVGPPHRPAAERSRSAHPDPVGPGRTSSAASGARPRACGCPRPPPIRARWWP